MRLHCWIDGSREICDGYEDTGTMSTILEDLCDCESETVVELRFG